MESINSLKSRAFLTYAEWGPDLSIPRDERLASLYPEVPAEERAAWIKEFTEIDGFADNLAYEGKAQSLSAEEFAALIRKEFPFMDDEAVGRAHFLAAYYQWHG